MHLGLISICQNKEKTEGELSLVLVHEQNLLTTVVIKTAPGIVSEKKHSFFALFLTKIDIGVGLSAAAFTHKIMHSDFPDGGRFFPTLGEIASTNHLFISVPCEIHR